MLGASGCVSVIGPSTGPYAYDTRDDLISALIVDVYDGLAERLEAARDSRPERDRVGRVLAVGEACRSWAIASPQEFRLVYGDPVAGYEPPEGGAAAEAERRACAVLLSLVASAWPDAEARQPKTTYRWSDFGAGFVAAARASFPGLPPAALAVSLRLWGRMHGLVALEVYGHLAAQAVDPGKLYRAEMRDLASSLGLGDR